MALFRMGSGLLEAIDQTSFPAEGLREREDIQRLLRDQPSVIEEGLFVVAEEFGNWQESGRRIDLLCLGIDHRLVVVELKRDERGGAMELQAVRYAAMVSNMTFEQIVDAHEKYHSDREIQVEARACILSYLESDGLEEPEVFSERPRIILASGDFSKELTTSVIWLNNVGLDIRCVRLRPYKHREEIILDVTQVLPLPEAEEYMVKVREKASESEGRRLSKPKPVKGTDAFLESLKGLPKEQRENLERLCSWAKDIEQKGRANLYSVRGDYLVTLQPRIPGEGVGLVTIINDKGRGNVVFFRTVFERCCPEFIPQVESIIAPKIMGQGNQTDNVTDELLEVLRLAYEKASSDTLD